MKQNGNHEQVVVVNGKIPLIRTVYFYAPPELAMSFRQYGAVENQRGELWKIVVDKQFAFDEVLDILRDYK